MTLAANARAIARTTSEQLYIDDTGALRSTRFDDFYFNPGCGAEETQHVFLQGNRLAQRWADAADASASQPTPTTFCIAETGFGTGLNFLAALDLWQATHEQQLVKVAPQLVYYATEKYPLSYAALAKALQHYNPYPGLAAQLLEQYPDAIAGDYLLPFNLPQCRASLVLLFGDSVDALGRLEHYPPAATAPHANSDGPGSSAQQQARGAQKIDAWLLDGFAPAQNPSMWSAELFAAIGRHSGAGSTAATFSVARAVRDGLASAGFTARKQPGFGRKRDMLSAQWARAPQTPGPARKHFTLANCYRRAAPTGKPGAASQSAIVIGAGIAGCCTAHHLAARGWQVTVIDRHQRVATEASGNSAAVLYARTAAQRATLADYYEASLHYAQGFYRHLLTAGQHGLNGMLVLNQQLHNDWLAANPEARSRRNVTPRQASALANINLAKPGIFYPHSGYLRPATVCQQLLDSASINFCSGHDITEIQRRNQQWHVRSNDGFHASANVLVLAVAGACKKFTACAWLPLKTLRGQTTDLPALPELAGLAVTLCEQGYCTPLLGQVGSARHAIGATYNLDYQAGDLRDCDQRENLDKLGQMLQRDLHSSCSLHTLGGRASLRCISPDYLPMVGNVVQQPQFLDQFASLSSNARQTPPRAAPVHEGLFINTAYGSQGFSMAPLASEILAAEISGEPVPIGDTLRQALSPARFLVRQLIKSNPA